MEHCKSHPSRVRGLKHDPSVHIRREGRSHPSRVRGLKHRGIPVKHRRPPVAPLAGAWIETLTSYILISRISESHPSRVRGLKPIRAPECPIPKVSHPSRVRGLKPPPCQHPATRKRVAPLAGAWIETSLRRIMRVARCVAPLAGAWIETRLSVCWSGPDCRSHPSRVRGLKHAAGHGLHRQEGVAPHAGAWIETESENMREKNMTCRTPRGCVD